MTKPKALYIHIPFCNYICDYCDFCKLQYFYSDVSPYLNALKHELESYKIGELDTIYIGGGTPTSLSNKELETLLKIVEPYSYSVKEYTVEANPDSLSLDKLKLLKQYGVNRLSIGVESTHDDILSSINRHHTFNDVKKAVKEAREIGFNNINLDLILGLPDVSLDMIKEDINSLIKLEVEHISCYSLTVNEHTSFAIRGVKEPEQDTLREFYDEASKILENKGYVHYEVSNYAKKGNYSFHNLTYWKNERYYGIGLGASGYIDNVRYVNTRSISKYLKGKYRLEEEIVTPKDDMNYQIMLSLRTCFGLDLELFKNKFKVNLYEKKKSEIDEYISNGFLFIENNYLKPTYNGMMILDSILVNLFL